MIVLLCGMWLPTSQVDNKGYKGHVAQHAVFYMAAAAMVLTKDWWFDDRKKKNKCEIDTSRQITGWWFGAFFIFHNIWE